MTQPNSWVSKVALHFVLIAVAAVFVVPFIWMVSSSFKTNADIFLFPPRWIPRPFVVSNYVQLFEEMPFARFFMNSVKVSGLSTFGLLLSTSLAGYAFARFSFPGRDAIFYVLLATMMIPREVTMIPTFLIMRWLGWINTHLPLIVPSFLGSAFGTFLMRQFFMTLPGELEDAARIDGCSRFTIYSRVFLPLAGPALGALGIFSFMAQWNNLLDPVIYVNDLSKMTLTVGLASLRGEYYTDWGILMAGALVSVIPILIVYAAAQKYFVKGITMSGIKG